MRLQDIPKHLRPREKLVEKGVENLKTKELLAIILRTGTTEKNVLELSEHILKKYPIDRLQNLKYEDLKKIKGLEVGKICSIIASLELGKRSMNQEECDNYIHSPQDALVHLTDIRHHKKEYFVALFLNARNQLVHKETISIGTVNASIVHPREVFEPALRLSTCSVIVAHNHPSGDPEPSEQDIEITKRLVKAGDLLGIELLDHLILTSSKMIGMKSLGYL